MLLRLISVISLINFMLLLISGSSPDAALYRSILIFLILFTVVYLTIFFLNVIRRDGSAQSGFIEQSSNNQGDKKQSKSS